MINFETELKNVKEETKEKTNKTYLATRASVIDMTDIFFPPKRNPATVLYLLFTMTKYNMIPTITPRLIPNKQYSATLKYIGDTIMVLFLIFTDVSL